MIDDHGTTARFSKGFGLQFFRMRLVFAFICCIITANAITVPASTQEQSVKDLIGRVFGEVRIALIC